MRSAGLGNKVPRGLLKVLPYLPCLGIRMRMRPTPREAGAEQASTDSIDARQVLVLNQCLIHALVDRPQWLLGHR